MGNVNKMPSMVELYAKGMSALSMTELYAKDRPPENSQMPTCAHQQVQGFNTQDSLTFSTPSVLDLQNSPFANNTNMTSFFNNFLSNFQNQMMQKLAELNQKIKQYQERLNQAPIENAGPGNKKISNPYIGQIDNLRRFNEADKQMSEYLKNLSPERKNVLWNQVYHKPGMNYIMIALSKGQERASMVREIPESKLTNSIEKLLAKNWLDAYAQLSRDQKDKYLSYQHPANFEK